MVKTLKQRHFLLYEITFLTLMAALVYVFKTYFRTPLQLTAHNAILWTIPFIIGVGITKKFGSATYIGVLSGLLIGTIGMNDEGIFKMLEWVALGATIDVLALFFRGHLDNIIVGFLVGALGNIPKGVVNVSVGLYVLQSDAHVVMLGLSTVLGFHLIFGGIGGVLSAIILNRVKHVRWPRRAPAPKTT